MVLNFLKSDLIKAFPHTTYNNTFWLIFSSISGRLSDSILINDIKTIEYNIMLLLYAIIKLAYVFNIDLDSAWVEWKKKAYMKKYVSKSKPNFYNSSSVYSSNSN